MNLNRLEGMMVMIMILMLMIVMILMLMMENEMLRPWDHGGDVGCYVADILRDDEEEHHDDNYQFRR